MNTQPSSLCLPLSAHLRAALEDVGLLRQANQSGELDPDAAEAALERVARSIGHVLHLIGGDP